MKKNYQHWKGKLLNFIGRLAFVNAVLNTIWMASMQLPVGVIERIDRKRRNFLSGWGGRQNIMEGGTARQDGRRFVHQRNWGDLESLIYIYYMNHRMLMKWWRYYTKTNRP